MVHCLVKGLYRIMKPLQFKVAQGMGFGASKIFKSVADGATVNILIENPSTSKNHVRIVGVFVAVGGKSYINLRKNVQWTETTNTEGVEVYNLNLGCADNSCVIAKANVSISTGSGKKMTSVVCPGATGSAPFPVVGAGSVVGESILMPPGTNLYIEIQNASGAATDISIEVLFYEITPRELTSKDELEFEV